MSGNNPPDPTANRHQQGDPSTASPAKEHRSSFIQINLAIGSEDYPERDAQHQATNKQPGNTKQSDDSEGKRGADVGKGRSWERQKVQVPG